MRCLISTVCCKKFVVLSAGSGASASLAHVKFPLKSTYLLADEKNMLL